MYFENLKTVLNESGTLPVVYVFVFDKQHNSCFLFCQIISLIYRNIHRTRCCVIITTNSQDGNYCTEKA